MRRGHVLAVSSATLFLSTVIVPCHLPPPAWQASASSDACQRVAISEFYPCGLCDDEYFVLESCCEQSLSLRNWSVTDGEGTLRFVAPLEVSAGGRLVVAFNSTSYQRAFGEQPDLSPGDPDHDPLILRSGTFRLADAGDSIALLDGEGVEVDRVAYGACGESGMTWTGPPIPALKTGEVGRRLRDGGRVWDTDSAADWLHFREFRYGFTDLEPLTASIGPGMITVFASPDCGLAVVLDEIGKAEESVKVCGYELHSPHVCSALLSALGRGVEVKITVDGAPAGGMSEEEAACLSGLAESGADVRVIMGNVSDDVVRHIGPLHAKYIVVDELRLTALSENFVPSGLPSDPFSGNRGWGVALTSSELAGYVDQLFDSDSRASRPDVRPWRDDPRFVPGHSFPEPEGIPPARGATDAVVIRSASVVTLMPSPDSSSRSPFLCDLMRESSSLLVEQFQADLLWKDRWTGESYLSPLLSSAEGAVEEGAKLSLLLDSSWFNAARNGEVAAHVNSLSSMRHLAAEARLMDLSGPVSTLHNKGVVADGRVTVISSNNWVYSSFARNRELALMIQSEEVAAYFTSIFEADWEPDREPPLADAGPDAELVVGESMVLDGTASSDDRAIARWEWRLEGEGILNDLGSTAVYFASRPGEYRVHLIVQDAWGNTGTDTVAITVSAPLGGPSAPDWRPLLFSAMLVGGASASFGVAMARKLNHWNRSSR